MMLSFIHTGINGLLMKTVITGPTDLSRSRLMVSFCTIFTLPMKRLRQIIWVRHLSDPSGTNRVSDLAVDQSGNLYLYGDSWGAVEGQQPYTNTRDLYLTQLSEQTGNLNWIQRLGSESDQYAGSMAIGSDGGIVLSGRSSGPVDALNVDWTKFLAQYSTSGEHLKTTLAGSWGMAPLS